MSELRTRMIRDMALRGFSPSTHEAYLGQVVPLAKYYKRSPDQLTNDEVHAYLAHLIQDRKLSWSTCRQAAHAFRFLYHVTPGHAKSDFHVPAPRQPQKLPEILSREDVWRLLDACTHTWHRLLLATTYAAGLRVSEVVALKVSDLDADRMTVRVQQGKGADRPGRLGPRPELVHRPEPTFRPARDRTRISIARRPGDGGLVQLVLSAMRGARRIKTYSFGGQCEDHSRGAHPPFSWVILPV